MKDEELMVYIRLLKKWKKYVLVCCSKPKDPKPTFEGFMEYLCNLYDIRN